MPLVVSLSPTRPLKWPQSLLSFRPVRLSEHVEHLGDNRSITLLIICLFPNTQVLSTLTPLLPASPFWGQYHHLAMSGHQALFNFLHHRPISTEALLSIWAPLILSNLSLTLHPSHHLPSGSGILSHAHHYSSVPNRSPGHPSVPLKPPCTLQPGKSFQTQDPPLPKTHQLPLA